VLTGCSCTGRICCVRSGSTRLRHDRDLTLGQHRCGRFCCRTATLHETAAGEGKQRFAGTWHSLHQHRRAQWRIQSLQPEDQNTAAPGHAPVPKRARVWHGQAHLGGNLDVPAPVRLHGDIPRPLPHPTPPCPALPTTLKPLSSTRGGDAAAMHAISWRTRPVS